LYPESGESIKRTDIVLGSTEPANYTGSYITGSKEIVDAEEISQCAHNCRTNNNRHHYGVAIGATARTTMELLLSRRGYLKKED
jgi:hypothetical protein